MSDDAVKVLPKEWRIERIGWSGDLTIKVNDFVYLTLHYDYRYTSNATRWALAKQIVASLVSEGDTAWSQDGDTDFIPEITHERE